MRQGAAGRSLSHSRYPNLTSAYLCGDRPTDRRNLCCLVRSGAAPAGALARLACCPPPAVLNDAAVAQALRTARRGTAAGLSGATCEQYKLLLDDAEAFERAANLLVAARVPANVAAVLGLSRFTSLCKPNGGVRGIAIRVTPSVVLCRAALPVCLPTLSTRRLGRTGLRYI